MTGEYLLRIIVPEYSTLRRPLPNSRSGSASLFKPRLLLLLALFVFQAQSTPVVVRTLSGLIRGETKIVHSKPVHTFLGIPYANQLERFGKSVFLGLAENYTANKMPPLCYQSRIRDIFSDTLRENELRMYKKWTHSVEDLIQARDPEMDENCLRLNIWTPRVIEAKGNGNGGAGGFLPSNLPVMIWIHGGNFLTGGIRTELYNGSILASFNDVVVVTIQYRLGIFGTNPMDEFQLGLDDQRSAILWIKDNIRVFGGSPDRITLFGSGAGALSIFEQMKTRRADGVPEFQQAILQSYENALGQPKREKINEFYIPTFERKMESLGCNVSLNMAVNLDCLKFVAAQSLLMSKDEKLHLNPYYPIHRGKFDLTELLIDFKLDNSQKFRTMLGWTTNEMSESMHQWLGNRLDEKDMTTFTELMGMLHFDQTTLPLLLFEYDFVEDKSLLQQLPKVESLLSDVFVKCSTKKLADTFHAIEGFPRPHVYSFEHRIRSLTTPSWTGVMQGSEIDFIFGQPFNSLFQEHYYKFSEDEKELSRKMMRLWTNFAYTGDPNLDPSDISLGVRPDGWAAYPNIIVLKSNNFTNIREFPRQHQCQLIQTLARSASIQSENKYSPAPATEKPPTNMGIVGPVTRPRQKTTPSSNLATRSAWSTKGAAFLINLLCFIVNHSSVWL